MASEIQSPDMMGEISETEMQYTAEAIMSGLSILFCCIVIIGNVILILRNKRRTSALKLVTFLCASEVLYAVAMLLRPPENEQSGYICGTKLFLRNFAHILAIMCTTSIVYSMKCSINLGYEYVIDQLQKLVALGIFVSSSVATLILCLHLNSGDICSVVLEGMEGNESTSTVSRLLSLLEFQGPIYVSFVINVCMIRSAMRNYNGDGLTNRVRLYPLVIPICASGQLFYQLAMISSLASQFTPYFITFHMILSSSQGMLNAIVFGFTQNLKKAYQSVFCCNQMQDDGNDLLFSPSANQAKLLSKYQQFEINQSGLQDTPTTRGSSKEDSQRLSKQQLRQYSQQFTSKNSYKSNTLSSKRYTRDIEGSTASEKHTSEEDSEHCSENYQPETIPQSSRSSGSFDESEILEGYHSWSPPQEFTLDSIQKGAKRDINPTVLQIDEDQSQIS